jgi:hypothetical protein
MMNERDTCVQQIVNIYLRSVEPGWDQMKTFLEVGEQGGVWLSGTSFVYYPGQVPETFTATWFDAAGDMMEKTASSLMLELWGYDKTQGQTWYSATLTIYPNGRFEFVPSSEPEKSVEEILAVEHLP